MNINLINSQVLALLGDAVFSLYIRSKLIENGMNNSNNIQKKLVLYVSAKGQVEILHNFIKNNLLNEEELEIVKRGRNNKNSNHPKNTDIGIYKQSTGFEALLGALYISNKDRLYELLNNIEVK